MPTMTITITASGNGVTWSRSASIVVDTALIQTGDSGSIFATEGGGVGTISYSGAAVVLFANKARGSLVKLLLNEGTTPLGPILPTHLPFVMYSGVGTGFTGAAKFSATATHTPDNDLVGASYSLLTGPLNNASLVGLKLIS
jgi:hypothetical protein